MYLPDGCDECVHRALRLTELRARSRREAQASRDYGRRDWERMLALERDRRGSSGSWRAERAIYGKGW